MPFANVRGRVPEPVKALWQEIECSVQAIWPRPGDEIRACIAQAERIAPREQGAPCRRAEFVDVVPPQEHALFTQGRARIALKEWVVEGYTGLAQIVNEDEYYVGQWRLARSFD